MNSVSPYPIKVYLDTADWAYLEEGKATEAEQSLRTLGESGAAVYLISHEHWVEIAGLSSGRHSRIKYLRDFPGAYRLLCGTDELLQSDGQQLVAAATGTSMPRIEVIIEPLASVSLATLEGWVADFGQFSRYVNRAAASIERTSRAARQVKTADDIRSENRKMTSFLRGDTEEFLRQLRRRGEIKGRTHEWALRRFVPTVGRIAHFLHQRGKLPFPQLRFDPVFSSAIIPTLPEGSRSNPQVLDAVFDIWKIRTNHQIAPSLACYATLIEAIHGQPSRDYSDSERVDARHAAYVPLVDVFTCDKRNHEPLKKTLRSLSNPTQVIRTMKHDQLLKALPPVQ